MTELTFLVDLLLNHKLAKNTREAVAERIKVVEQGLAPRQVVSSEPGVRTFDMRGLQGPAEPAIAAQIGHIVNAPPVNAFIASQTPATQAMLAKNPDLALSMERAAAAKQEMTGLAKQEINGAAKPEPQPVAQIAQNAITMTAMAKRNETISLAMSGKVDKETGRPRKW